MSTAENIPAKIKASDLITTYDILQRAMNDLIKAFEEILEMLIEMGYEEAAMILDEFRIH